MATHSSILAWEIPWTEEPGGLQPMVLQRIRHDLATKQQQSYYYFLFLLDLKNNNNTVGPFSALFNDIKKNCSKVSHGLSSNFWTEHLAGNSDFSVF